MKFKKLRLGFYPYAFARVSVMKSDLITCEMWEQYLKMGPQEILRSIVDKSYKEISEVANTKDTAALEMALNKSMMNSFRKLHRISDEKLQKVIELYAQRYDIENVKTIIRGKIAGIPSADVEQLLLPSLNYPHSFFIELMKKETPQDILDTASFSVETRTLRELSDFEHALDTYYMKMLLAFSDALCGQGKAFSNFITTEVMHLNLKIIMRSLREGKPSDELLIQPTSDVLSFAGSSSIEEFARALHKKNIIETMPSGEIYADLEIALDNALLRKESLLIHQHPLTVNVMLGFMLLKEIEVKNLKIVLKGKLFGLHSQDIERLVIAS